ncbi:MAG: metallophosphoesterase [Bacteroidia bacterium]|nr:metallophosphoesterase [Bacteroidia bacterium]
MKRIVLFAVWAGLLPAAVTGQPAGGQLPAVHSNLSLVKGKPVLTSGGIQYTEEARPPLFTLPQAMGLIAGTATGLDFDFRTAGLNGKLYYGFVPYGDSRHPHPVYFKETAPITAGKASVNIRDKLRGRYDMVGWENNGSATLGYRIAGADGTLLYDGLISFSGTGPFTVEPTVVEGPFVGLHRPDGATISFRTNLPVRASLSAGGQTVQDPAETLDHILAISGLSPDTEYAYTISYGKLAQSYAFRTAPAPGSRAAFTFAYASDSRNGQGGGERDLYGTNFYIMKKIMALAKYREAAFFQFSGDLIDGYLTDQQEIDLQYANWKRAIAPFAHYFPVYVSMGNHEALMRVFSSKKSTRTFLLDRFPYETQSAEAAFARNFVLPRNGPASEDGAAYDPDPAKQDFPSYAENVYFYTHGNTAVIVLNSNYWYAPSTAAISESGGGVHGYLMDQQLAWLRETLDTLERNPDIDHVFVTQHTPAFPNGGHVADDMWYNGDNRVRPWVAGKALEKGIIERRDQYLDLLVNRSSKVVAILTGDEHNYARTEIGPDTRLYLDSYPGNLRLSLRRTIWQINNGAAGAPYYAQEFTPWTPKVSGFTTQNALVLFHVEGPQIRMEVLNPDTLEPVDELRMK